MYSSSCPSYPPIPPSARTSRMQSSSCVSRPFDCFIATSDTRKVYNDLRHPPATYVSSQYAFRTADGSYNNVQVPDMGKAGLPYSRSVQQTHPLPNHMLPDPGLVFDTLLRREKVCFHMKNAPISFSSESRLVRRASCWPLQSHVLLGRPRHPHVSLLP